MSLASKVVSSTTSLTNTLHDANVHSLRIFNVIDRLRFIESNKNCAQYNVLAAATDDIHCDDQIRDKVIATTADNGSNFEKPLPYFVIMQVLLKRNHYHTQMPGLMYEESDANDSIDDDCDSTTVCGGTCAKIQYIILMTFLLAQRTYNTNHLSINDVHVKLFT